MRRLMRSLAALAVGLLAAPLALAAEPAAGEGDTSPVYVKMSTSMGDILIEVDRLRAPLTSANFLKYVDRGFYDNTIFHRVMPAFVIQGGGYSADEKELATDPPIKNEWRNGLLNERGSLSMARKGGQADSASSQFFINIVNNQVLDQPRDGAGYAVFAKVIAGLDVVDKIAMVPTIQKQLPISGGAGQPAQMIMASDVPQEKVIITSLKRVPADDNDVKNAVSVARVQEAAAKKSAEEARHSAAEATASAMKAGIELAKSKGADPANGSTSASGLWHADLKVGDGAQPKPSDKVRVHYTGWLTNGTKFDSSVDRGAPAEFPLDGVIKGWTEGVGGMKQGGKRMLVIPPELAYGAQNRPPIPPNSVLVFEVELLEVLDASQAMKAGIEFAKSKGADPEKGVLSPSGLWAYDVKVGDGIQPKPTDKVKVHYTGWLTDGTKFDSSVDRGSPLDFALNGVIAGWTEGVGGMKKGGKRLLVIPPALGYRNRNMGKIPPNSVLVFEVELLDVMQQ